MSEATKEKSPALEALDAAALAYVESGPSIADAVMEFASLLASFINIIECPHCQLIHIAKTIEELSKMQVRLLNERADRAEPVTKH